MRVLRENDSRKQLEECKIQEVFDQLKSFFVHKFPHKEEGKTADEVSELKRSIFRSSEKSLPKEDDIERKPDYEFNIEILTPLLELLMDICRGNRKDENQSIAEKLITQELEIVEKKVTKMDPIFKQGNAKQEMKNWLKILPHLPVIALFALHHFQLHPLALVSRARLGGLSSIHVWTITTIIHYATALYVNQQFFLKNRISNKKKEPTPLKGLEQKNVDYIPDEEIPFDSSSDLPQKIEAPPISGQQPVTIESSHLQKLSKLDIDSILDAMAPAYGNVESARKAMIDSKNPEIF